MQTIFDYLDGSLLPLIGRVMQTVPEAHRGMCSGFVDCLYEYQTLVTGVLAVLAGAFTLLAAWWQIRASRATEARRRQAETRAARAMLTFALDQILEYAEGCAHALVAHNCAVLQAEASGLPVPTNSKHFPTFPGAVLKPISECIRHEDSPERLEMLASLANWLQIHEARVKALKEKIEFGSIMPAELSRSPYDSAELYYLAEQLYHYAREIHQSPSLGEKSDRYLAVFLRMGIDDSRINFVPTATKKNPNSMQIPY
ncbi:hypothetical protein [Labrys monachus]|uniref:DUF4760 domain-containing protein n=1 Tax=Labrys monachus TaxID=217067 RepID=A0ABU0F8P9_9HYPH|nr:hypothetical protein [Labrys monachus]MDQ0390811.1 hypothetical protein [Labrys monachus]